ncbi:MULTISPECIES: mandelate racemase/muconate lactonizing enzyme family protein [Paenibacillus]|uniref:Mandelate racemase n=1 Tax=Paenibacillus naphthalenovorans TaxID=162209 RepID=A0A0U2VA96_9BACL|nr:MULTISPECIES: mandelate racemase/muconate lactonizing enzyme family protein [Paenibacillus]ALS20515.1 mandelate racemase [Paenibacillus naphthalenovorans]NTZ18054.1 mandelate racemase/muconate lactonizing enzyme family protein [Paenibacillus sp. JMULE4]
MSSTKNNVIEQVTAMVFSCRFDDIALRFGVGNMVKRDLVLVKITCSDGTIGYGEAHHALSPTSIAELIRSSLAPILIGESPFNTEGIWEKIYRHQVATHGAGTAVAIAMSGIDIALWDIKGKMLQQPVYRLLGGERRKIRAYAGGLSLGYQPLESLEKEVQKYVEQGYTAIKLRVGQNPKKDAERVSHIRKTFGPQLDIAVDAATRYHILDVPEVVKFCEENHVYWLEEPFTPDNIQAYHELRKSTRIPIAAGENHYTKYQFRELLQAGTIDIVQADCTKAGGITEVKKISDMAAAWHLPMAPHTSQSMLSTAANIHLLCAIPNALIYEADLALVNPFRDEMIKSPLIVKDGYIEPNDRPGLGLELDEEALSKYPGLPGACYVYNL